MFKSWFRKFPNLRNRKIIKKKPEVELDINGFPIVSKTEQGSSRVQSSDVPKHMSSSRGSYWDLDLNVSGSSYGGSPSSSSSSSSSSSD